MKILTTPHPFLRRKAKPVKSLTKKTISEVKDMIKILKSATNPEGVGLAATQVGIDKRIFVLILSDQPHIFVNPIITETSKDMFSDIHKEKSKRFLEGCLSMPQVWGFVNRPFEVALQFQTFDPYSKTPTLTKPQVKRFTDIQSAYAQHERDHLDGILFTDHILKQKGTILKETPQGLTPLNAS